MVSAAIFNLYELAELKLTRYFHTTSGNVYKYCVRRKTLSQVAMSSPLRS